MPAAAFALALMIGLGACGDEVTSPVAPSEEIDPADSVAGPTVLTSRLDGRALDARKLDRFRAVGEGCTFLIADGGGLSRRIAVPRARLPFALRPIRKDALSKLGDGKYIRAVVRLPEFRSAVRVGCFVPSSTGANEFGQAIVASNGDPRWHAVLSELARERPRSEAELERPLSPEAREFLFELAPSLFRRQPLAPAAIDNGTTPVPMAHARMDGCNFPMLRGDASASADDLDTLVCSCRNVYTLYSDGSERVTEECMITVCEGCGGPAPEPEPAPAWPEWPGSAPDDYGQEQDKTDTGGTPTTCTNQPPPTGDPPPTEEPIPYGPNGWYVRSQANSMECPPPTPVPPCDWEQPGCDEPPPGVDPAAFEVMSAAEKEFCKAHMVECAHYAVISKIAIEWVKDEAAAEGVEPVNNKYDAMRHVFWSAALTKALGPERAFAWTEVHERDAGNPEASCMDRYNNALGRTLALEHPDYSDLNFQVAARNMANAGVTKNAAYKC